MVMNQTTMRLGFSIVLGLLVTPLAGFIGAVMFPGLLIIWLVPTVYSLLAIFAGPSPAEAMKTLLAMLSIPALTGAYFAWPVTCIILPVAAALWRPVTAWASLVFLFVGFIAGGLTTYVLVRAPWIKINSNDHANLYLAGVFAGAIYGSLFGRVMWRYDRKREPDVQETLGT
jgi:hypothetical protein